MPILPENTTTLEEFIKAGHSTKSITYDSLSYKNKLSNGTQIAVLNVIDDYIDELKAVSTIVELSDTEYSRYRFKPKLLCYDVYGSTELYYVILRLNGIVDVKDFDFKKFRMLKIDRMELLISEIYNAEKKFIDDYNSKNGIN